MTSRASHIAPVLDGLEQPALIVSGTTVSIANNAARRLLGDSIEGHDVRLAIRHPHALEIILAGRDARVELVGIGSADRPWQLRVSPISPGEALVLLTDRSEAVTAERMRTDFVANASHELRTPLATLIGYGETLAEPGPFDDEMRARFGQTILTEAQRMQRIVEDLMSLSRIEAGRYIQPSDKIDLRDMVEASARHFGAQDQWQGFEVKVALADEPMLVLGDRAQLGQLVDNLIGNALRYGCNAQSRTIALALARVGGWVRLTVQDHGDGISQEHLPRLTERFYRVDAARSREAGGTGLGLAIVKHIVERHRGVLRIQSEKGAGTLVQVDLPGANLPSS